MTLKLGLEEQQDNEEFETGLCLWLSGKLQPTKLISSTTCEASISISASQKNNSTSQGSHRGPSLLYPYSLSTSSKRVLKYQILSFFLINSSSSSICNLEHTLLLPRFQTHQIAGQKLLYTHAIITKKIATHKYLLHLFDFVGQIWKGTNENQFTFWLIFFPLILIRNCEVALVNTLEYKNIREIKDFIQSAYDIS